MGKGGKKPRKNVKKPKKLKVAGQSSDKSDPRDPDSTLATPDVDAYVNHFNASSSSEPRGYPKPTTYNTDEIYIPMKVFQFNTFIEISERARTDYGAVQQSDVFRQAAITEDQIVDNIVCGQPNKLVLLSEAGNGKSTMARKLLALCGEKYPDKMSFFLDLKGIGQKDCRSLTHMILPEDYQKGDGDDNKKNSTTAMKVIFKNPADCIFIIDSLEDLPTKDKVIDALLTGKSETEISTDLSDNLLECVDRVLPTWQWINELLIGPHFGRQTKIILLARPDIFSSNPFYHRRPGMGWSSLNEDSFLDSGFGVNCIFGLGLAELQQNTPETITVTSDMHDRFLKCIERQPSFAYFCRKPCQMLLFYDTFTEAVCAIPDNALNV